MGQTLSIDSILFVGYYKIFNIQQDDDFNLQELQFPFERNRRISCSLPLSNNSDYHLAFKVTCTNAQKYCVSSNIGVVLPRSTFYIRVTMKAQEHAPPDMQCKDTFTIQTIVLSKNGATIQDVTREMFNKESGYEVKDYKLKVVYVAPPQPPSPVREGSDKDLKASNKQVEQQDTSLQIHPQELQFPFELRKQISCSLQLSNKSDNDVAFKVKTTDPKKYCVKPNHGVVLPRSTFDIIVTMQGQKEAPPDMQCKDRFLVQSIVANHKTYHSKNGATTKDITPEMFKKESGYEIEERKFKVIYVPPPQPPSSVREGSDEDLSPRASDFSDKARALISKLTEKRNSAIDKYIRLEQVLLRVASAV